MRAIIQRVSKASVTIGGEVTAQIGHGLLILLGVTHDDTLQTAEYLAKKCAELRIFTDDQDKMNLAVMDLGGELLVVSNFTLYAACAKGRRPDFIAAARPEAAVPLYRHFVESLRSFSGLRVVTGEFGADMEVALVNDGPVTIFMDTNEMRPSKGAAGI